MLRGITALLILALTVGSARSQIFSCFDCKLGIWDDVGLGSNIGTAVPYVLKEVYVGIDLAGGTDRLTGIELSVAGMRTEEEVLLLGVEPVVGMPITLGDVRAPADTSATSTGRGGMNAAWPDCLVGDRALLRLRFVITAPITDRVFQVKRRYPTTNPNWRTPVIVGCDGPYYASRVTGDCYILNWSGDPKVPCETGLIGVEPANWSAVKQLYK